MKNTIASFIICFFNFLMLFSFVNPMVDNEKPMFKEKLSERITGYEIDANIDVKSHVITGKEKIFWFNNTEKTVNVIKFHLYMNAFSSVDTVLMREARKNNFLKNFQFNEQTAGYTKVKSIKVNFSDLTNSLKINGTVATLELPYNVKPGESIVLNIEFLTKLPRVLIRSGYADSFHMVSQWFPKLGVLNKTGDWECNTYSMIGEFYSDFGVYKCSLTFPKSYLAVGTGEKRGTNYIKDLKKVEFYAEDVHDFAFVLWDKFKVLNKFVSGKTLYVYYPNGHENQAKRILDALTKTFQWYEKNLKQYPYPDYKIIDVPFNGLLAGGMEYETFSTVVSLNMMPEFLRLPEKVTIHEFGHSYFRGMVANNEKNEGWLDEGLNTYITAKLMDEFYKDCSSQKFKLFCKSQFEKLLFSNYKPLKFEYPSLKSTEFVTSKGYRQAVYAKVALMLKTIENYLGKEVVLNIYNRFVNEFSFKHPKGEDFIKILNEETENAFNGFIDKYINSELFPDASVLSVNSYTNENFRGFVTKNNKMMYLQENKDVQDVSHEIVFGKREMPISMNFLIKLSNGKETKGVMMGNETIKKVIINTKSNVKVIEAHIDYDKKAYIDLNRQNNKYNVNNNKKLKTFSLSMFYILLEWISYVF